MQKLSSAQLLESLEWRYATKKFDPSKKIDVSTWNTLEKVLMLTPSSYGLQPWKFIIVESKELKEKLQTASWNQAQVTDCSHHVVFVIKEKMDEEHITKFIEQTAKIRGQDVSTLEGYKKMMIGDLVKGPRSEVISEWAARQAYIALGNFMTAAATLGVDTCPFEGIEPQKYDDILGLTGTGWKTVCACPAGYRAVDDKYAEALKVRFDAKDLIIHK
ncbi:MAG: NAD(P)H-dependent oxidoreductase [Bacteriovorax sp.]|nr:NAD(P)H-dependent oxidoreductase [Bacteriovorax sp.]